MGLISVPGVTDGTAIDAADINVPVNAIVNEINGNLNNLNLADSAVTTPKLADANVTLAKLATDSVSTEKVVDKAITTRKMYPSLINYTYSPGGVSNATIANTWTDSGASTTYTTGATPELLFIWVTVMHYQQTSGASRVRIVATNGTIQQNTDEFGYGDTSQTWDRPTGMFTIAVAANTTCTIKIQHQAESSGTSTLHVGSPYNPRITGFAVGA